MKVLFQLAFVLSLTHMMSCCFDDCNYLPNQLDNCTFLANRMRCLSTSQPSCQNTTLWLAADKELQDLSLAYQPCQSSSWKKSNTAVTKTPPISVLPTYAPFSQVTNQLMTTCITEISKCSAYMANYDESGDFSSYNFTELCKQLWLYLTCMASLLSSDCGSFVPQSAIERSQQAYSAVCSAGVPEAQSSIPTLLDCTNRTLLCHQTFNASIPTFFTGYDFRTLCSSIHGYSQCVLAVGEIPDCAPQVQRVLQGLQSVIQGQYNFCGNDQGETTHQCGQDFQNCQKAFNLTFYPAVEAGNLGEICSSLHKYTSCVAGLPAKCSRQLGQLIHTAQTLRLEYADRCYPKFVQLASCQPIGQCGRDYVKNLRTFIAGQGEFCRVIEDYFPCVKRGLQECNLPESSTAVDFGNLGGLMDKYCRQVSGNAKLLKCWGYQKCSAAVLSKFTPNVKNLYDGSRWCTFLQLSIGCAEQALQSTECGLQGNKHLQARVSGLDARRVAVCEAAEYNLVEGALHEGPPSKSFDSKSEADGGHGGTVQHNLVEGALDEGPPSKSFDSKSEADGGHGGTVQHSWSTPLLVGSLIFAVALNAFGVFSPQ